MSNLRQEKALTGDYHMKTCPTVAITVLAMSVGCSQHEGVHSTAPTVQYPAASLAPDTHDTPTRPPVGSTAYIVTETAVERAAPSKSSAVLNRVYRHQKLNVYEWSGDWARVTTDGYQERWVAKSSLSTERPPDPAQLVIPEEYKDARIVSGAIPDTAGNGLTKNDVLLLWRGAKYMLDKGRCRKIDYADKSTSRGGTYFVQDGNRNVYFTKADLR